METFTLPQHELTHEAARTDEHVLLEGPHSRRRELWLVLRAVRDFTAGFRLLHFVGPSLDRRAFPSRTRTTRWDAIPAARRAEPAAAVTERRR